MWWGGGGDEPPASSTPDAKKATGDSTASSPEDVMEILSEEDTLALEGAARESPTGDDDSDTELQSLKDQFLQQESLLGQLKGVLKSNEEKLISKEKEVQVCCMIFYMNRPVFFINFAFILTLKFITKNYLSHASMPLMI